MNVPRILPILAFCAALAPGNTAAEDGSGRFVGPLEVLADLVLLRPTGLALTAAGAALFIGTVPLTAIASVAPPYDAFEIAADALVATPAAFTFLRPLGEFSYEPAGIYRIGRR